MARHEQQVTSTIYTYDSIIGSVTPDDLADSIRGGWYPLIMNLPKISDHAMTRPDVVFKLERYCLGVYHAKDSKLRFRLQNGVDGKFHIVKDEERDSPWFHPDCIIKYIDKYIDKIKKEKEDKDALLASALIVQKQFYDRVMSGQMESIHISNSIVIDSRPNDKDRMRASDIMEKTSKVSSLHAIKDHSKVVARVKAIIECLSSKGHYVVCQSPEIAKGAAFIVQSDNQDYRFLISDIRSMLDTKGFTYEQIYYILFKSQPQFKQESKNRKDNRD